jgi:hypothetical protein
MEPPRLKTRIWVEAVLRANASEGRFGAILNSGAEEAGSVYVAIDRLNGTLEFLAPAPGASIADDGTKRFVKEFKSPVPWPEIRARIERLRKADPDIWVIEIEDRNGYGGITIEP